MQFIKPGTEFDFIGKRKIAATSSAIAVLASLALFLFGGDALGPRYGVDFSGGTEIHLKVSEGVTIGDIREGLASAGLPDDKVQEFGTSGVEYLVRVDQVNFGADEFFKQVQAKLIEVYGQDYWRSFDWDPEQSVTMTARASAAIDPDAIEHQLKDSLGKDDIGVTESKVDHNAVVVSFPGLTDTVKKSLGGALGSGSFEVESVEMVGPSVGAELREKGIFALLISLLLILVYVAFRFDLAFAPGAVGALFHDVLITVGFFCIFHKEFTIITIGALLTIVGYSLNDTIVVFDRIRENMRKNLRTDLGTIINMSLNETLSRTVLTSITTLLAVVVLYAIGGPVIRDFAFALAIGVVIGTYSSIYVASPMIIFLQRWLPVELIDDDGARKARERAAARAAKEAGVI